MEFDGLFLLEIATLSSSTNYHLERCLWPVPVANPLRPAVEDRCDQVDHTLGEGYSCRRHRKIEENLWAALVLLELEHTASRADRLQVTINQLVSAWRVLTMETTRGNSDLDGHGDFAGSRGSSQSEILHPRVEYAFPMLAQRQSSQLSAITQILYGILPFVGHGPLRWCLSG